MTSDELERIKQRVAACTGVAYAVSVRDAKALLEEVERLQSAYKKKNSLHQ